MLPLIILFFKFLHINSYIFILENVLLLVYHFTYSEQCDL